MAAYAAVVSLMKVIDDLETHPSPPISLDKQQVESLTKTLVSLQKFLESYDSPFAYNDEADPLEMRIVDAAHTAEDVIESYIIDTIQLFAAAATEDGGDEQISCIHFYQDLQNEIEELDLLKKEVAGIPREKVVQQRNMGSDDGGLRSSSSTENNPFMVGFDDVLLQLLDRLTDGNISRQIIPIVGMGGIGKTTLAKGAFEHKLIKERFGICVWTTISQHYNIVETLREVLSRAGGSSSSMDEKELVVELHKLLWGRRYLIILDDMWSIDVWDKLKFSFPDCGNGSRILVTTRMSNLAAHLTNSYNIFKIGFLDEVSSWTLFSVTIFGEQSVPTQLVKIGKKIVKKCNGLPLAIAVIGGLMAKSDATLEYWVYIEENLSSKVNSENNDYCLRILKLGYNQLPVHLKPCFLYMGLFKEDRVIRASEIVELWNSEGFLKPVGNTSLTTIAKEYLKELVDRNLILVHKFGLLGNCLDDFIAPIEIWKMHKLRHVSFYTVRLHLPSPPSIVNDIIIMENLEVLKGVKDFSLSEDVVKRIPNIKKLNLKFELRNSAEVVERVNRLSYLQCLTKLESFNLIEIPYVRTKFVLKMSFPPSLKKSSLFLENVFEWEDILPMIGSLPLLQKLILHGGRFRTGEWETIEDQFPSLNSLTLDGCYDLENWIVSESSHFPLLQELRLRGIYGLKKIPSEIGEIPTLRSIKLYGCSETVLLSAKEIIEEQEETYGDQLDLKVTAVVLEQDKERVDISV
ncbi:putative late blight resistance protein homolog R1A-10 [Salvia hispanica]|uniref:putative late blight resistance protein homolog R1A-10 n=1 Tax=Salvia hispanica TaxID=49212 RepID=UPI002009B1BB|nr:putative late blight resistance protein homolog R1A-10 [Salvia hispanica]